MKVWTTQITGDLGYDYIYVSSTQRAIDEIWHHFHRGQQAKDIVAFPSSIEVDDEGLEWMTLQRFKEVWQQVVQRLENIDEIVILVKEKDLLCFDE